jgi:hypothetical protein
MVVAAFVHGNDFEMDAAPGLSRPAGNNPSFFRTLAEHGYETAFLCATAFPGRAILNQFSASLPPVWTTNDFRDMLGRFEACAAAAPFAVYTWSQVPHVEANLALAPHARSLDDLVAGACAVADNLLGAMLEILGRRGVLDDTTIVVYGDHGDDYWTHGFKMGLLHGIEPYTALIHTPLVIRDRALPGGTDGRLVSTVDLAATCLGLLGIPHAPAFAFSGRSLLDPKPRAVAYSQNFTASQPDDSAQDVRKTFAAIDHSHALQVSSRGLALFNYRLDPGNHTNLLHYFELDPDRRLLPVELQTPRHMHFGTIRHLWYQGGLLQDAFTTLLDALKTQVATKNQYAAECGGATVALLDMEAFERIDRSGRDAFFNRTTIAAVEPAPPTPDKPRHTRTKRRFRSRIPRPVRRTLRLIGYCRPVAP